MDPAGDETPGQSPGSDVGTVPVDLARAYYRSLDDHDYERLSGLLAPTFVHERPDRTLDGRERFVRFMQEERPDSETSHPIDGVYVPAGDDTGTSDETEVVVRGRLLGADGNRLTTFVDVFTVADDALQHLRTFTY